MHCIHPYFGTIVLTLLCFASKSTEKVPINLSVPLKVFFRSSSFQAARVYV
jgi:hypothetical protein